VRAAPPAVRLVPWTRDDLPLLVRLNAPEMMEHLGGPETDEKLRERNDRYASAIHSEGEYCFKVVLEAGGVGVGGVNFWDREWNQDDVYEMGWGVIPEFQGNGIASAAVALAVELARNTKRRPAVHAFPAVDNPASNALCRTVGFTLHGEVKVEYPKGHWMRCNDWSISFR
jgi:RimJ/RimL family protein N-acetyltransferase